MTKLFARRSAFSVLLAVVALSDISIVGTPKAMADTERPASFSAAPAISDVLRKSFSSPDTLFINPRHRDVLTAFYEARNFEPLWVDQHGQTRAAQQLLDVIDDAASWGLTASDFVVSANRAPKMLGTWTADQAAAADVEISQLVIEYALQARGSRIAEPDTMLSTYLDRRPRLPDRASVLAGVAVAPAPDALLLSYHPQHEQFQKLRQAYVALSSTNTLDRHEPVPRTGPLIMPGDAHPDVRALRARLKVAAADETRPFAYDAPLVAAVRKFQSEAGLTADGYIGSKTRRALNVVNSAKVDIIRANMEQWRWMPDDLGSTHLFVNIPAFNIQYVRDGETVETERVIVGKESTQTPIFSRSLATVVLRPEWFLPDSIKLEKLLSSQRRGSNIEAQGYVIRKGSRIVPSWKINWAKANLSAYEFFQPSGDGNALGDVKFLFPNKHSVYLHDTPSKSLFSSRERLFSHGCIRLDNPLALAQTLLDGDKGQGTFDVKRLVRSGPGGNTIQLDKPLPIHIGYFTAWVESDGVVRIYRDYYSHEQRIKLALDGKWRDIDKGDDHLAAVDTVRLKAVRVVQKRRATAVAAGAFAPPFGATKSKPYGSSFFGSSSGGWKRDRNSVGDMMRSSLGGH